ncbi:MAG: zinc ribbon domain-containing protein [Dehalococcoidia bacterium]|nr:zinc ribbon domain-containing protein [Dehalococcoidia bacterium]
MPIYEYQCGNCGQRFEVRQSIGEGSAGLSCPKCHAPKPERLFSSFSSPVSSHAEPSEASCPTCSTGLCGLPPMG